jgi:TPR repeat protein
LCFCKAQTQFNLGVKYAFGKGVLKDDKQAVYWYQKAADQGYAEAQSIDWIVLLHIPDQLIFDTNTQLAYNLLIRLCH